MDGHHPLSGRCDPAPPGRHGVQNLEVASDQPGRGDRATCTGGHFGDRLVGASLEQGPRFRARGRSKQAAVPVAGVSAREHLRSEYIAGPVAKTPCWNEQRRIDETRVFASPLDVEVRPGRQQRELRAAAQPAELGLALLARHP